jgi:hypothetical protein
MMEEFNIEGTEGDEELSLLETLDHVLDKGVVTAGDITISVANIDLIYLGLNVILGSVETVDEVLGRRREAGGRPSSGELPPAAGSLTSAAPPGVKGVDTRSGGNVLLSASSNSSPQTVEEAKVKGAQPEAVRGAPQGLPRRINVDERSVEQGLAKLVLTLIELIRRLLEKQAVRRMEGGRLADAQVEELGLALMKLEEKMRELKGQFGLEDEDLNLDLGPVGRLI